ncbi:putative ribonuclease H-like domain-containing protein [Tanacetum coccineum]
MKSRFQMSSMGEFTLFLGLQVKQKEDGIFISQDKYVAEILKKFDFASVKTTSTLIETQKPLTKDGEVTDVDVHLYRSMIGSLMYLTASRPNIMFTVCACSRFQIVTMLEQILIGNPQQEVVNFLAGDLFHGNARSRKLWLLLLQRQNILMLVFHSKTKHIEIRHHFIRDAYEKKLIQVLKIHTDDNVADLLTKAFDVSRRWTLDDMMMIWGSLFSFLRATYGDALVSSARLINTARTKLSTARLGWCCSKVFYKGVDAWIGSKMQFGLDLRVLNGN